MDCIFCRILAGEVPATKIYEDDLVLAFLDIQPVNPGHILVIPKKHHQLAIELDDETSARLFIVAKRLNAALRESGLRCEGVNYFLADGEAAMQEVFHVHLHLIPRYAGDGFGLVFPEHYKKLPERKELDRVGEMIREHVGQG